MAKFQIMSTWKYLLKFYFIWTPLYISKKNTLWNFNSDINNTNIVNSINNFVIS